MSFFHAKTDFSITSSFAEILLHLEKRGELFIPFNDKFFKNVPNCYYNDVRTEGRHSYKYNLKSERVK